MIFPQLDDIDEAKLLALTQDKMPETGTLEFKERLPGTGDSEKKEFLKDVCAMANADGGDILYGIKENKGCADQLMPIITEAADDAIRRLNQLLDACIERRLHGVRFRAVPVCSGGYVLALRIPQSQIGPHRTAYQGQFRFPVRNQTHISDMSYEQLRMAFDRTATLAERARAFRSQRIAAMLNGNSGKRLAGGTAGVVHILPLNGMGGQAMVDMLLAKQEFAQLAGADWQGISRSLNLDGLLVNAPSVNEQLYRYVQLYRSGALEHYGAPFSNDVDGRHFIPSQYLAEFYRVAIGKGLTALRRYGMTGGAFVGLALLSVDGCELGISNVFNWINRPLADRSDLVLPEQWVESIDDFDVDAVTRPLLDMLWQCFDLERCTYYDVDGRWNPNPQIR
ncbi:AlbA family DNA-binding domain-containing protein [Ralstonia pseudosolanacearum]